MGKMVFAIAAILSSSLLAEDARSLVNSYNPAVTNGADVWVELDLLYLRPWEKALVATNKESDVFTTDDFTHARVVHPHFDWSLGYRLRSGYLFSSCLWDVEASWTHFTSRLSQHRSTDSPFLGMFPIWSLAEDVIAGDYVFDSTLQWKFSINVLDVQFGRYWNARPWLDLKPYFGLRSAWIHQHGKIVYQGGMFLIGILSPGVSLNGSDYIEMKNNYWGMGPRIGLAPRWILGKGFSLNADAAVSGLYGFFNVKQKETYLDTTRFYRHRHPLRFRWFCDFAAGVEWKRFFECKQYALTFKVDWEYHLLLRQFEFKTDDFDLVSKSRNLALQGVSFSVRFDF
jgi:hypothetical protein